MSEISIIGSGGWGTAIAILLANNGHSVTLWSYFEEESKNLACELENKALLPGAKIPDTVKFTSKLSDCCEGRDLIITAVPSHTMRTTSKNLAPYIKDGQLILNISKGFDEENLMRLSEVIKSEIPNANVAVMSGPSHAEEVGRGIPTTNVVAHSDLKIAEKIQDIFMTPVFRVYTSTDVIGVELGGSIKNVIALCAGICDGIGYGDNTKAALMTRGLAEIIRLADAMGAKRETLWGLAGMGDLIVTCTSMHSRNRRAGILIGQGKTVEEAQAEVKMVVEGVKATRAVYRLKEKYGVEMPIVDATYNVLFGGMSVKDAVNSLMIRERKSEINN